MRSRCQGIRSAVPDIAAAVTVEVHCMGVVGGGDELGLAHGAGPGATHGLWLDVAMLDDLQRGNQLILGKLRAAAFIRKGRE
ncbi:hypothetical protein D3C81_1318020 [compost metagenome]